MPIYSIVFIVFPCPGQFAIDFAYESKNGTGTGEISLDIDTVDGVPLGKHEV